MLQSHGFDIFIAIYVRDWPNMSKDILFARRGTLYLFGPQNTFSLKTVAQYKCIDQYYRLAALRVGKSTALNKTDNHHILNALFYNSAENRLSESDIPLSLNRYVSIYDRYQRY